MKVYLVHVDNGYQREVDSVHANAEDAEKRAREIAYVEEQEVRE